MSRQVICKRQVKYDYPNFDAASRALDEVRDSRGKPKAGKRVRMVEQRAYQCDVPEHGWHLTSRR